jgi:phasin family protein
MSLNQENPMYPTSEQIQATTKANVEAILALATSQFAALEKIAGLNAGIAKTAFEDSIANARALVGATDVQDLVNLQRSFAQPAIDRTLAYSRSVYEVATHAGAEMAKAGERRVAEWKEDLVSLLDQAAKNAPAGSEVTVTAVKQMLAVANTAYGNFSKVAKHATEIADESAVAPAESMKGHGKPRRAA